MSLPGLGQIVLEHVLLRQQVRFRCYVTSSPPPPPSPNTKCNRTLSTGRIMAVGSLGEFAARAPIEDRLRYREVATNTHCGYVCTVNAHTHTHTRSAKNSRSLQIYVSRDRASTATSSCLLPGRINIPSLNSTAGPRRSQVPCEIHRSAASIVYYEFRPPIITYLASTWRHYAVW